MLQSLRASIVQCVVIALLMGMAACGAEERRQRAQCLSEYGKEDPHSSSDEEQEAERLIMEGAELLSGRGKYNDDAVKAAEDIFSRPEVISRVQMLFRSPPQGKFKYFNWSSLIYQIKELGSSEFSELLFTIASAPYLNPVCLSDVEHESVETRRLAAISALGALGDIDILEELLELVPPHTQRTVWLELHLLDSERWPMEKL